MADLITEAATDIAARPAGGPGLFRVRIITAGLGSSGYYPADTIRKAVENRVWSKGMHVYLDHPGRAEGDDRPERTLKDLVGVLAEDAVWDPDAQSADTTVKVYEHYRPILTDMADDIGLSIRAYAAAEAGAVDGYQGPIVTDITEGISVDFVTKAGRGGRVLQVLESARDNGLVTLATSEGEVTVLPTRTDPDLGRIYEVTETALRQFAAPHSIPGPTRTGRATNTTTHQEASMPQPQADERAVALESERDQYRTKLAEAEQQLAERDKELAEARATARIEHIKRVVGESDDLPATARQRVADMLTAEAKTGDVTDERITAAVEAEKAYIAALTPARAPMNFGAAQESTPRHTTTPWGTPIAQEA